MATNQPDEISIPANGAEAIGNSGGRAIGAPFNPYGLFNGSFIPESLSRYRGISPGAKLIYARLCRYAGENGKAFPSVAGLGDECGMSASQTRLYLKELTEAAFVRIDAKSGSTNSFVFLWHSAFDGDLGARRKDFRNRRTPLQQAEGVPLQETEAPTPSRNCSQRESSSKTVRRRQSGVPAEKREIVKAAPAKPIEALKKADDDSTPQKPLPKRAYASDTDELLGYVEQETGKKLSLAVVDRIRSAVEGQGATIREFLDMLRADHNLKAADTVEALLTKLARQFRLNVQKPTAQTVEVEPPPKCQKCSGKGYDPNVKPFQACECASPKLRELIDRMNALQPIPAQSESRAAVPIAAVN